MKVALYARVSSEKQDTDLSLSAQLKALREYASRKGYTVIKEYVDEAESGRTSRRPAFLEMMAAAKRKDRPFDLILVWKYFRFARSLEDSIVFKTMLRKYRVQVSSINEPTDDSPTGKLLEAMIESLDEFYSANLGEDVTRGTRESASRGFWVSPRTPYGFRRVKVSDGGKLRVKLEQVPAEAAVVKRLFHGVMEGKGLMELTKELNREGIPGPRGKNWGKTSVHQTLRNEVHTGTLVWGCTSVRNLPPIRVENAWPAVVDKDTFEAAQKRLADRGPRVIHPRRTSSRYLLSGLARCGHCGKALVGQDAKGGKFTYYVCGTLLKRGSKTCPAKYLPAPKFEGLVIDKIKQHILTEDNLKDLVRLVNEEMDTASAGYQDRLETVTSAIADVNHRLERLYDALETGKLNMDDLSSRIQQLRARLKQLNAAKWEIDALIADRHLELADEDTVGQYVQDLRTLLSESSLAERRAFIRSFVKEVKVAGDQVVLTYTIPMPTTGVTEEAILVPPTVQYGGRYRT